MQLLFSLSLLSEKGNKMTYLHYIRNQEICIGCDSKATILDFHWLHKLVGLCKRCHQKLWFNEPPREDEQRWTIGLIRKSKKLGKI